MGVTVTFMAILELVREGLIDIVQAEPYAPLHVRPGKPAPQLRIVDTADAQDLPADFAAALPSEPAAQGDTEENADD